MIIDGINDLTLLVFLLVIGFLIYLIKLATELKDSIIHRSKSLDSKVANLESRAVSIRREVVDLHKSLTQKLDREEFERRIDGLIELVGKKEKSTEKKKDMR